jgi:hypothetical protein
MGDIEPESFDEQTDSDLSLEQREAHRERLLNTVERMELEYDKALLVLHPLGHIRSACRAFKRSCCDKGLPLSLFSVDYMDSWNRYDAPVISIER